MRRLCLAVVLLAPLFATGESKKTRPLDALAKLLAGSDDVDVQKDVLRGMADALAGRRNVSAPEGWAAVHRKLSASKDAEVRERVLGLSVLFGDPQAMAALRKVVEDLKGTADARTRALQTLVEKRAEGTPELLRKLLDDEKLVGPALRGLAGFSEKDTPTLILKRYPKLGAAAKADALATLASRPAYALALLDAVEAKQMPRGDVTLVVARQISTLGNKEVGKRLEAVWGSVRPTSKVKESLLAKYRKIASKEALSKANRANGRVLFEKTCATCHMLFGEGKKIGPDLTGSQRANPEYILHKVLDPHATVPLDFQVSRIVLNNGRVVTGLVTQEFDKVLLVQLPTEEVRIQKSDIESRERQKESLMPEGILEKMRDQEVRDLLAYLASPMQVALPKK